MPRIRDSLWIVKHSSPHVTSCHITLNPSQNTHYGVQTTIQTTESLTEGQERETARQGGPEGGEGKFQPTWRTDNGASALVRADCSSSLRLVGSSDDAYI